MSGMPKDPCIWAWKQYAIDLNVTLMTQRLYLIDREIERMRTAREIWRTCT